MDVETASAGPVQSHSEQQQDGETSEKKRRAFKACAHCRSRKAKCDLGDLNNPREPPCARCRREGITCVFLPSRRGGRVPWTAQEKDPSTASKAERSPSLSDIHDDTFASENTTTTSALSQPSIFADLSSTGGHQAQTFPSTDSITVPSYSDHTSSAFHQSTPPIIFPITALPSLPPIPDPSADWIPSFHMPTSSGNQDSNKRARRDTIQALPRTTSQITQPRLTASSLTMPSAGRAKEAANISDLSSSIFTQTKPPSGNNTFEAGSAAMPSGSSGLIGGNGAALPAGPSPSGESHSSYDSVQRKNKRKADEVVPPERLAAAKLHNPVDALNLLVLAADRTNKHKSDDQASGDGRHQRDNRPYGTGASFDDRPTSSRSVSPVPPSPPFTLSDFPLVSRGIVSPLELIYYINLFFSKIHHIFPMVPYQRIPTTEAQLTTFARDELHLTTTFVYIASRNDPGGARALEVHNRCWAYLQELIKELVFGKDASVGSVEALLLLSENPPREIISHGAPGSADENRMSWMLVGTAVRLGYMLALDQTSLHPLPSLGNTPEEKAAMEKLDRERIAWTYCYLFDRQISIRTGKAFWSRGPGLCFSSSATESFPSMRPVPGMQDDFAALIAAHVDLTQIMTNAHDILYPSRDRTIALVRVGEYYKYIDEFTRTLNNFHFTWESRKWATFPLSELVWITFHYLRLYIYAFAFQAHIQRSTSDAHVNDGEGYSVTVSAVFPRGSMGSPDAKFILEAIDAAADLLRICTERLHPQGILPFLPWRYFLYFAYAGVFLLKAVFIGAVAPMDRRTIVRLLKRLIVCLACASKDEHHHSVRYARLLNSLLRKFSRGQDSAATANGTPTDRMSPAGSPPPTGVENNWPLSRAGSPQPTRKRSARKPVASADPALELDSANSLSATSGPSGLSFSTHVPLPSKPTASTFSDAFFTNTAQEEQRAADLLSDFNLDFGFSSFEEPSTAPFGAYSRLFDDTTLDFWAALSGNDWQGGDGAS